MTSKISIPIAAALAVFALASCSSDKGKSKETADSGSHESHDSSNGHKKFSDRISASVKHPETHRSSFEKQALASRDSDLQAKSFHTKDYAGKTASESMDKKFTSKEFTGSDKKDKELDKKDDHYNKSFAGAEKTDNLGAKEFDASKSKSKMADQTSHDAVKAATEGSKSFNGRSKSYSTKSDSVTTNALNTAVDKSAKNKKIDPGKPAYSEDEVRALLNKG